jgi:uncharacterized membrane protein YhaH (DUF805 family)
MADFRGRESRGYFWPYAGAVIGLTCVGMFAIMIGPMADSMRRMQEFAIANPDQATIESGPGHYSITVEGHHPEFMPDMGSMMIGMDIVIAFAVILLSAAVARRLHDRGRTGLWGLMPLPFLAFASIMMPRVMRSDSPDLGIFFAIFFNNMIYIAALVALVIMLAGASESGPNRYGEQPN